MLRNALHSIIFLAGLVAAVWVGIGYVGSHAVGATVAFVIAACYLAGGVELFRYRRSTAALAVALEDASAAAGLVPWLQRLPAELRSAVRLRVDGERVSLPAPALTPYLVGLLVLLGMLGTLLGMMATLRGTGIALESATDLQAIRGSLASPVEGLAVAFGTSIAGVATSAMLGLLSSLLRRERLAVTQALDARIAGDLQPHTQGWQRTQTLRLLQLQADAMPALVDRLQALVDGVQQASQASHAQLDHRQAEFNARSEDAQRRLQACLEAALERGVDAGASALGAALEPLLATALDGLAREGARTQANVAAAVRQQLDALRDGFEGASDTARSAWHEALAAQQAANAAMTASLQRTLDGFATTQQQAAEALAERIGERLQSTGRTLADGWRQATEQQQRDSEAFTRHSAQAWQHALDAQREQTDAFLQQLREASEHAQARMAEGDAQRVAAWTQGFTALAEQAGEKWRHDGEQAASRQARLLDALEATATRIAAEAQQQASTTIAEIGRLLDAAAEAPRAAAEVVAGLRQRLSESLVRDTAMLEERARLLGTVDTLMESVTRASSEQRVAVDGLIEGASAVMERAGSHFAEQLQASATTLDTLAQRIAEGSGQATTLAEGLEGAVRAFADTSGTLTTHLQQLAGALDASLARSDEQLAYYVAQAREVVDLSLLSQKQVIEELQQLASRAGHA